MTLVKVLRRFLSTRRELSGINISKESLLQMAQESEFCAVVDENDRVLGSLNKLACHFIQNNGKATLHRAFSVILFDSRNRLLLQKRSKYKRLFPEIWSNACCSHPRADDIEEMDTVNHYGIKRAAIRRLSFELGIDKDRISFDDLKFVGKFHYSANYDEKFGENEIDYCLVMMKDIDVKPNVAEVERFQYVTETEFEDLMETSGKEFTPWIRKFHKIGLFKEWFKTNKNELKKTDGIKKV